MDDLHNIKMTSDLFEKLQMSCHSVHVESVSPVVNENARRLVWEYVCLSVCLSVCSSRKC